MAVVNVEPGWKDWTIPIGLDGKSGQQVYTVLLDGADSITAAPEVARQATGIPRVRDLWSGQGILRCSQVTPEALSLTLWRIICDYNVPQRGGAGATDPLDEPADVMWEDIETTQQIDEDINGAALLNSAGKPYDGIMKNFHDVLLIIERNEASFSGITLAIYQDSVNQYAFYGAPPESCYMRKLNARRMIDGSTRYWRAHYEIVHRHPYHPSINTYDVWKRRILDAGLTLWRYDAQAAEYAWTPITDREKNPISEAALLDGSGELLAKGGAPTWNYYEDKRVVNWRPLLLE